jgi:hypothetical protein
MEHDGSKLTAVNSAVGGKNLAAEFGDDWGISFAAGFEDLMAELVGFN